MRYNLLMISLLLLNVGCQRELLIDVPNTAGRAVIEANISPSESATFVRLTRTTNLSSVDSIHFIDDAQIELVELASAQRYQLRHREKGFYIGSRLPYTQAGQQWQLNVVIGVDSYSATTTLLPVVEIDSLKVEKSQSIPGHNFEDSYTAYIWITNPGGANYYRVKAWVNEQQLAGIVVFNDQLFDDRIQIPSRLKLKTGDLLRIELQHISAEIYQYYYELNQTLNSLSNSPANPTSNIVQTAGMKMGDVLGYFSIYSASKAEIRIQ